MPRGFPALAGRRETDIAYEEDAGFTCGNADHLIDDAGGTADSGLSLGRRSGLRGPLAERFGRRSM